MYKVTQMSLPLPVFLEKAMNNTRGFKNSSLKAKMIKHANIIMGIKYTQNKATPVCFQANIW